MYQRTHSQFFRLLRLLPSRSSCSKVAATFFLRNFRTGSATGRFSFTAFFRRDIPSELSVVSICRGHQFIIANVFLVIRGISHWSSNFPSAPGSPTRIWASEHFAIALSRLTLSHPCPISSEHVGYVSIFETISFKKTHVTRSTTTNGRINVVRFGRLLEMHSAYSAY